MAVPVTEVKEPAPHAEQAGEPSTLENFPAAQLEQKPELAVPLVPRYSPAAHVAQVGEPAKGAKRPALQSMQLAAPPEEYRPAAQDMQPVAELMPDKADKSPAEQGWHAIELVVS